MIHQTSRSRTASLLRFVGYFVWSSHCCIFFRSLCFTTFFRAPSMCCTYVVRHLSNKQKRERRTDYNTCWHADRKDPPPPIFGTLPPVGGDLPPFWSSAKSHTVRSAIGTRQYFRQSINTVTESETKPKHSASCCIQSFSRQTRCTSVQQTSSTQSKERGKRKEKRKKTRSVRTHHKSSSKTLRREEKCDFWQKAGKIQQSQKVSPVSRRRRKGIIITQYMVPCLLGFRSLPSLVN